MKTGICFLLTVGLLLALLFALPQSVSTEALAPLSVTVLPQGQGGAVIFSCGGQTLVLDADARQETQALTDFLKARSGPPADLGVYCGEKPAEAVQSSHFAQLHGQTWKLGSASLCFQTARQGQICHMTVLHGENRLVFSLVQGKALRCMQIPLLDSRELRLRLDSDGTRLRYYPDFSNIET